MKKTKSILIITFLCFNINLVFSQKNQLSTKWQTEKYNNVEDISNMDFLYDSDAGLLFLLTNDEENLYVHLRTIDEIPERKLIDLGFSIEIKVKGDKTKRIVEYPLPKKERTKPVIIIKNNSEERRKDFSVIKEQIVKQIYQLRLRGFNDEVTIVKASGNNFDITGNLKFNKNAQLQYLVTIPLKILGLSLADDLSMNITLKSGNTEEVQNQRPTQNVDGLGGQDQGIGNRPGIGDRRQGSPPQGNRSGQDRSGGNMEERAGVSKAINVKLKNIVLLKKTF